MKKMQKKYKKICIYEKKAVPLHREIKKHTKHNPKLTQKINNIMNKTNFNFAAFRANINRNFRIKVNGIINGVKRNVLVGVSGLLEILGGSIEKLQKFVNRAFASMADKCACKIYGGATVTFYVK